jgi:HrpA-like RNA helicase
MYLDDDIDNYVQASVTKAIEIHQSNEIGDILVFLTGQDEIDLALNELNQKLENDETYIGLPLHGKLSEEENARIFEKMTNIRKIIFSTNVAETSITIDGIKHVIETGMVKEKMWDQKRKMQVLQIGQVTQSSVKQRRGRAGRTSAGKVIHCQLEIRNYFLLCSIVLSSIHNRNIRSDGHLFTCRNSLYSTNNCYTKTKTFKY